MVETIQDNLCMDGSEGVLAIVVRSSYVPNGVHFVTEPDNALQVACMSRKCGDVVQPHKHCPVERSTRGTQEVIIMRWGRVRVDIYNSANDFVASKELYGGDTIVLLSGGHSITMLADSQLLEVKQGPYAGTRDKEYFRANV